MKVDDGVRVKNIQGRGAGRGYKRARGGTGEGGGPLCDLRMHREGLHSIN